MINNRNIKYKGIKYYFKPFNKKYIEIISSDIKVSDIIILLRDGDYLII